MTVELHVVKDARFMAEYWENDDLYSSFWISMTYSSAQGFSIVSTVLASFTAIGWTKHGGVHD